MKPIEIIVTLLFVLGGLAMVATVIKYPRDVAKSIFLGIPNLLFSRVWDFLVLITVPVWLPLSLLDRHYGWGFFERFRMLKSPEDYTYTGTLRKINFSSFNKYILITKVDMARVAHLIKEAADTVAELNTSDHRIIEQNGYIVVEVPHAGLFGFGLLVQWFTNELKGAKTFGYASGGRSSFFLFQDPRTVNNLIGRTDKGKAFSVSMYDDLDKKSTIRMNDSIKVNKGVTTDFFQQLVSSSFINSAT